MKHLSRWASRHVGVAVLLIVICEVANAFNGLLLGMNLFEGWRLSSLFLLAFGLVGGAIFLRMQAETSASPLSYRSSRRWLFGAFLSNYLLFSVLGGLLNNSVESPTPNQAVFSGRRVVMRSDTLVQPDRRATTTDDYYAQRNARQDRQGSRRVGFILLFVLGTVLYLAALVLACNLACANYGAAAALVLVLGLGAHLGGLFFLSRALEKIIKPWRAMERPERRRVNRRFLLIWLGLWVSSYLVALLNSR